MHAQREGFVSTGRAILAVFFMAVAFISPTLSSCLTFGCYLLYVITLRVLESSRHVERERLGALARLLDVVVFGPALFLMEGVSAASAVYFVFLLLCCSLHLQLTFYALAAAVTVASSVALHGTAHLSGGDPELWMAPVSVVVVALFLGLRGVREYSFRRALTLLAEWPSVPASESLEALCAVILPHAAAILGAPRILVLLEDEEEPWVHTVLSSEEGCDYSCDYGGDLGTLVPLAPEVETFFCNDAGNPQGRGLEHGAGGVRQRRGATLSAPLCGKFGIKAVAASRLAGKRVSGYLLALDRKRMTREDLAVCEIAASQLAAYLENHFAERQLQKEATLRERMALARDLHDGLLQSMAGAVLDLERAQRLVERDPESARSIIQQVQQHVALEQKDIRLQVTALRGLDTSPPEFDLCRRVKELGDRIARQWKMAVHVEAPSSLPPQAAGVARELYLMVHEALMNAVRHSGASSLYLQLKVDEELAAIKVADNGCGFPFRGSYDAAALAGMKQGPASLRERVAALDGDLSIDSRATGAVVEITIPVGERKKAADVESPTGKIERGERNVYHLGTGR